MIEIEHVEKSFKDVKVLKDVSLKCEPGKIWHRRQKRIWENGSF